VVDTAWNWSRLLWISGGLNCEAANTESEAGHAASFRAAGCHATAHR